MNKRIHKILGYLFISSTAFLWIACSGDAPLTADDDSESNKPHLSIDIKKELSNLKRRDIRSMGTTVTGYDACITRIIANEDLEHNFIITDKGELEAKKIVETKIKDFLESPKGGAFLSDSSNKCYTSVMNQFPQVPFDDDVKLCDSYSEEITIDDQNFKNLMIADEISREAFEESLKRANELLAGCDSPK